MNRHPGLAKELIKICLKPRPLAEQSLDGLQLGELAVAVEAGFPSRTIKAIGDERHAVLRTRRPCRRDRVRSEEHTSELQSLMRNSYAVFCLQKKKKQGQAKTQNRQRPASSHYH